MSDIVSPLLQWLNAHPQLAGLVTFIISAAESVAIIGTIVPGSIMMTALGALAGAGVIPIWETIFWAIMGAIVGDGISYWIGHYFKDRLAGIWPFRTNPNLLITGEKFVHKYGGMSVFIGRFVGPVRALVPVVAGMLGMKPLHFIVANVTSAILWAPAYMLPGILLGAASMELPPDIAIHVMLVLLLITLFAMLCIWLVYKFIQLLHIQIDATLNWVWSGMKQRPYLKPITLLLRHHSSSKYHGQLNLAIYFLFAVILYCGLALYVKIAGANNIMVNDALFHLFRGIRTPAADTVMIWITYLGQKEVILPVVAVIFAWLIIWKRWRAAFHAAALTVMAAGTVYFLKNFLRSERPWGIFHNTESFSMPSGHATLATTVFMGLAFIIAIAIPRKYRWPVFTLGIIISLAVGISRLYLGAHWFTDILSSWLLSAAVLIFVIISYQRIAEKPVNPLGITLVTIIALIASAFYFNHKHFDQLQTNYNQINYPVNSIKAKDFWDKNLDMAVYHTSLFGFPSQAINIEWVGDLAQIKQSLLKQGWMKPPARDLISTMHRIADISSTQYLPLVSTQYLDKKPQLILTRNIDGEKGLLVIRLWDANRFIKESDANIWVGVVGIIPRTYSWLFEKRINGGHIDPNAIFPSTKMASEWEWKILKMNLPNGSKKTTKQNILLIKPKNSTSHKK